MDAEQWKKLEEIYHLAWALPPDEQRRLVEQACAGDSELQREAESLLAQTDKPQNFLNSGAFTLGMTALAGAGSKPMDVLSIPQLLEDRYEIVGEIPGGGMGAVYQAQDRQTGWKIVVKVLKAELLQDSWAVAKFRQEVNALAKIEHPNVVRLVGANVLPSGIPYIAMKFVAGSDLGQILAAHPEGLKPSSVAAIMQQAGAGVTALHEAGFVHRDLKPGNFMMEDKDGPFAVKVIDLGIVRVLGQTTRIGVIAGTPRYLSPEQLAGQDATLATDIYALGVLSYELLTGKPLFDLDGLTLAEIVPRLNKLQQDAAQSSPAELLPAYPTAAQVILRALALAPDKRPSSAREFGAELAQALSNDEAAADDTPPTAWPKRWAQWCASDKRRLAVAVLVLAGLLGLFIWRKTATPSPPPQPTAPAQEPERALTYGLLIRRERDGRTVPATGREMFDTGSKFQIKITPAQTGAVYLFHQGTSQNWYVLFPTPANNERKSRLAAWQTITTKEYQFVGRGGKENYWLVWAREPVTLLEKIVEQSGAPPFIVSNPTQQKALREFLAGPNRPAPEVSFGEGSSLVTLKGRQDCLIHPFALEHKDWE